MLDERIQQLILLQSRDRRKTGAEMELQQLPESRALLRRKIEIETETIEMTGQAVRELEASSQKTGGDIEALESRTIRYKTQQLEVKRSEEYDALQTEIDMLAEQIASMEDKQLNLLEKIDLEQGSLDGARGNLEGKITDLEKQLKSLDEREVFLESEIEELEQSFGESIDQIAPDLLRTYRQVKRIAKRSPWVVPVENQLCGGCSLRVSNDVVAKALVEGQISKCDQCGRIVYFDR